MEAEWYEWLLLGMPIELFIGLWVVGLGLGLIGWIYSALTDR